MSISNRDLHLVSVKGFPVDGWKKMNARAFKPMLKAGLFEAAKIVTEEVQDAVRETFGSSGQSSRIERAAEGGGMFRSFKALSDEGAGRVVTFSSYAVIHDQGGIIKPKGKFLAFPIGESIKTRSGSRRGPKTFKGQTVVIWENEGGKKRGTIFLKKKRGSETELVPVFKLIPEVKIRARHFIAPAVERAIPNVEKAMADLLQARVDSAEKLAAMLRAA